MCLAFSFNGIVFRKAPESFKSLASKCFLWNDLRGTFYRLPHIAMKFGIYLGFFCVGVIRVNHAIELYANKCSKASEGLASKPLSIKQNFLHTAPNVSKWFLSIY